MPFLLLPDSLKPNKWPDIFTQLVSSLAPFNVRLEERIDVLP
jgi:hypothetical protein